MSNLRKLSVPLALKAATELNEDPSKIDDALRELRQWISTQNYLRARTNDQFLIIFLRASKYNLSKAKKRLENYYVCRKALPVLYEHRKVNQLKYKEIIQTGSLIYLTEPVAVDGARVILVRPNKFDMQLFSILDVCKLGAMLCDILMQDDDNAVTAGYIVIMDFSNVAKSVLLNFEPNFLRKMTIFLNKSSIARMKGFHWLNVPSFIEKLFNMIKSAIHTKLKDRFYVHSGNYESLYSYVPKHILPHEYGGSVDLDVLQNNMWIKLLNSQDLLTEEESYGVIGTHINNADLSAVYGSFRSLDID